MCFKLYRQHFAGAYPDTLQDSELQDSGFRDSKVHGSRYIIQICLK